MKYLLKYKNFESQSVEDENYTVNNEHYLKLIDVLLELFDEWNIRPKEEGFYFEDDPDTWPTNRFWTYRTLKSKSIIDDTSDFNKIKKDDRILNIIIFNIPVGTLKQPDEQNFLDLIEELEELTPRIKAYVGKELIIGHEEVRPEDPEDTMYYDVILRLKDLDKK